MLARVCKGAGGRARISSGRQLQALYYTRTHTARPHYAQHIISVKSSRNATEVRSFPVGYASKSETANFELAGGCAGGGGDGGGEGGWWRQTAALMTPPPRPPLAPRGNAAASARRETALIAACRKGDELAVAHALSVLPGGVDVVDCDGLSALVHAVLCLNARYPQNGSSAEACGACYERIVRLLLQQGARVDLVDRHGSNALHHASFMGHTKIAAALLERVPSSAIDMERANGESALSVAAFRGHVGVAQLLLKDRASVNKQSPKGGSALMLAASQGHAPLVSLLLSAAADAGLRAASGATALQIAQAQGHVEVTALLQGEAPGEAAAAAMADGIAAAAEAAEAAAAVATAAAGVAAAAATARDGSRPGTASRLRREVRAGRERGSSPTAAEAHAHAVEAEASARQAQATMRAAAAEVRKAAHKKQSAERERRRSAFAEVAAGKQAAAAAAAAARTNARAAVQAEARTAAFMRASFVSEQRRRRRMWEVQQELDARWGALKAAEAKRASRSRIEPPEELPSSLEQLIAHVIKHELCPHRCLGLAADAPRDVVRKRFLGLALRLHPDKADHPEARDAFAAMQLAFRSMQKRS